MDRCGWIHHFLSMLVFTEGLLFFLGGGAAISKLQSRVGRSSDECLHKHKFLNLISANEQSVD